MQQSMSQTIKERDQQIIQMEAEHKEAISKILQEKQEAVDTITHFKETEIVEAQSNIIVYVSC
jgi:hypothetical protein